MAPIIFGILWLIFSTLLTYIFLKLSKPKVNWIVFIIAILLISIKTIEFSVHWINGDFSKMPVEFSQISYFLFGFTVLFKLERIKPYTIFASFFSGISYMIVFPFFTDYFIESRGLITTLLALLNHSLLYIGGTLLMREKKYESIYIRKIIFWSYIFVLYSLSMRFLLKIDDPTLFIYLLLDAKFLNQIELNRVFSIILFISYHLMIFVIFAICVNLYYHIHHKIYHVFGSKWHQIESNVLKKENP